MQSIVLPWLATLPVFMVFNRIRGGGMSSLTDQLPGRALYYVSAIFGALTAVILDPVLGLVVGLGFLIWGAPGWGLWFDLHRHDDLQIDDRRRNSLFVKVMSFVSFGSDHLALFLRLGLFVLPTLGVWCVLSGSGLWLLAAAVPFAALGVGAYELRFRTSFGNTLSELIIGGLWWALVLTMANTGLQSAPLPIFEPAGLF